MERRKVNRVQFWAWNRRTTGCGKPGSRAQMVLQGCSILLHQRGTGAAAASGPGGEEEIAPSSCSAVVERPVKSFKHDRCPHCVIARRPVIHHSGPNKGKVLLRCGKWWQKQGDKRLCWQFDLFKGDPSTLPKDLQEQLQS